MTIRTVAFPRRMACSSREEIETKIGSVPTGVSTPNGMLNLSLFYLFGAFVACPRAEWHAQPTASPTMPRCCAHGRFHAERHAHRILGRPPKPCSRAIPR